MNTERFTARCFISSCLGLSNPCTTSTNLVIDLHFDRKNNECSLVHRSLKFYQSNRILYIDTSIRKASFYDLIDKISLLYYDLIDKISNSCG